MDDSTLIASSKRGIEDRLSITAEFYTLNNTQANSAKYILLSSEQFSQTIVFDLSPSPLIASHTLTLKALALSTSFRFLGVWFNLSASSRFVHNQTVFMVKDMATLLSPKKLLAQHVAYLYNVVLLPRLEFHLQTTLFLQCFLLFDKKLVLPQLLLFLPFLHYYHFQSNKHLVVFFHPMWLHGKKFFLTLHINLLPII
ncbi:hypothetical protein RirG_188130 [Rhizophagus irregularis DAOM 197198w]|uniref:Uncharacterized protein n=1 Tax=Rhizophagus irregularis (strain DAOM 197198w) TaxID=1432141 RepID=A0A015JWS2_RHIIW|nr:hypothetical protein RirG_188130 [Rhizophagus irregularis DAOM 197198w]